MPPHGNVRELQRQEMLLISGGPDPPPPPGPPPGQLQPEELQSDPPLPPPPPYPPWDPPPPPPPPKPPKGCFDGRGCRQLIEVLPNACDDARTQARFALCISLSQLQRRTCRCSHLMCASQCSTGLCPLPASFARMRRPHPSPASVACIHRPLALPACVARMRRPRPSPAYAALMRPPDALPVRQSDQLIAP